MKLTPVAKVFISLIVLSVAGYVAYVKLYLHRVYDPTATPSGTSSGTSVGTQPTGRTDVPKTGKKHFVVGVNDFGGAYPLILANDGATPGPGSLFTKAGLDVEIKLIRGSKERLKAFDDGEVDVMLLTLDYLANLAPLYKQKGVDLKSFLLIDWSRGNIGIVAKPQYSSIESLKKARIATTRNTPTHYLLLSLLAKSNLSQEEIDTVKSNLVFATKTPQAGEVFQRGEVDAVAIWEPHLSQCTEGGKGRTLVTTETATNLIADILFARGTFIKEHEDVLPAFIEAFFEGVKRINADPARAIELSAAAFKQKPEEIAATLKKIKPVGFADNRAFFGLETEDSPYDHLFLEASRFWQKEGLIKDIADPGATKWLKGLEALTAQHRDDKIVENFHFSAAPQKHGPSLLTKSISIYFGTGQSALDPNARKVIDTFADTLAVFQNAYVQVEGNTDNVGARPANVALSQKRAQSVVDYLVERHRFDRARFIAVGNGPDSPAADNKTVQGREMNRRTDFKIIKNAEGEAPSPGTTTGRNDTPAEGNGTLSTTAIQGVMGKRTRQMQQCYERELRKTPGLRGRVTLRFNVEPGGSVSAPMVEESTLKSQSVEKCLLASVSRVRFPSPTGGSVTVRYPFEFQSN